MFLSTKSLYFDTILDIGSGSGNVTEVLAESIKHRQIIGLDIDPKMIDFSIQNNTKPSIDYRLEDISKPWDELSADIRALEGKVSLVFSNSTLMMIQNRSTFVHNLRRLMADNSYAFTSFVLIHNFTTKLSPEEKSECEKWIKIPDYDKQVSNWTDVFTKQGFTIELTEKNHNYIINDTSLIEQVIPLMETFHSYYHVNGLTTADIPPHLRRRFQDLSADQWWNSRSEELDPTIISRALNGELGESMNGTSLGTIGCDGRQREDMTAQTIAHSRDITSLRIN
ncbi:unnamed protein product [Medioppia subpectinata]|uniref:Methyltransferase domain-containing protein n=1 Tax=Medioppia subpectinata TaxID=1979941 RepID=A0A7R9L7Y0_9ACAR|nr:unnamed protein product [Medioppia subpectinata]CAG2116746.1 unnamed protein product [Medioppia subpectinata]